MSQPVNDLVLEMANVLFKHYKTIDVSAKVQGVLTGLNLVEAWLEAGGAKEIWTTTLSLLSVLSDEGDLKTLIHEANTDTPAAENKFNEQMFLDVHLRSGAYSQKYKEGLCKGFLYGMRLYDACEILSSEKRLEFVLGHIKNVKEEISKL